MSSIQLLSQARLKELGNSLKIDIYQNAIFHYRVFEMGEKFDVYSDDDFTAVMAVQKNEAAVVFAGDWSEFDIPIDKLPQDGFFVHGCPSVALEKLVKAFVIDGSWPCWRYLGPDGYGAGPWDELGKLAEEEAKLVARYWDLIDDPEEILREKVTEYDSACVRVDGKLVSWVGIHFETEGVAELGFAHTLDGHRRKGYSSLTTKALVNRGASRGKRAIAHMFKTNDASIGLAESLGFKRIGEATWVEFGPRIR
ncbi:MAG: GNAT family N-acetyltransferase [Thermoplasmata archaeon]|nr:GNAT family N-acetyltransferase [Thermoplasmata archaeon]